MCQRYRGRTLSDDELDRLLAEVDAERLIGEPGAVANSTACAKQKQSCASGVTHVEAMDLRAGIKARLTCPPQLAHFGDTPAEQASAPAYSLRCAEELAAYGTAHHRTTALRLAATYRALLAELDDG